MRARPTGARVLCDTLERLGTSAVFGLPGSANVHLYDALAASSIRSVVATHELAAAFMANGYARATGAPGTLVAIPGPGLAYALAGLVEARLDSVPLLAIAGKPAASPGRRFQLQAFDQAAVVAPVVKGVIDVASGADLAAAAARAHALALDGEPGPVLLHVAPGVLSGPAAPARAVAPSDMPVTPTPAVKAVAERVRRSSRPVLFLGQGAHAASGIAGELARSLGAAVITTTSGRGAVAEDDACVVPVDDPDAGPGLANELLGRADLVLAVGCKLSHNGSFGFALHLPPERLVHVDASAETLGANYRASIELRADARAFLSALAAELAPDLPRPGWPPGELSELRARAGATPGGYPEPVLRDTAGNSAAAFFDALRSALPRDGILVTDSGHHQMLARRYFVATSPRSLIVPTDFQAMGFGLPAAIGAGVAAPGSPVVALVGDGGLAVSGLELASAVRERIPLTAIVFTDGHYQLIRLQQLGAFGRAHGTALSSLDPAGLASSVGARYELVTGDPGPVIERAFAHEGVSVLEVALEDGPKLAQLRRRGRAQRAARSVLGPAALDALKRRPRGT